MKQFEPRPYQKELMDKVKDADIPPLVWPPRHWRGVHKPGDGYMVTSKQPNVQNIIVYDEAGYWPIYKWYRNPIKWWRYRNMMKAIDASQMKMGKK